MSAKRIFGGVLALFIVFISVSCLVEPDTPKLSDVEQATGQTEQATNQTEQEAADQEAQEKVKQIEYLTLLKAKGNFTLEKEELENHITLFLNQQETAEGRSISGEKTAIIGSRKLPGFGQQTSSEARSVEDETLETEVYIFDTESDGGTKGYILASNDLRIGTVLAVVDGKTLEDEEKSFSNIIFSGLTNYIDYTIDLYNNIDDEAVQKLLGTPIPVSDETVQELPESSIPASDRQTLYSGSGTPVTPGKGLVHHWYPDVANVTSYSYTLEESYTTPINVQWHQNYPYNYYVNIENGGSPGSNAYIAGCGPIAMAQLMSYWGQPTQSSLNDTIQNTTINTYHYTYNWALMRNNFSYSSSTGAQAVAVLLYEIGHSSRMNADYQTYRYDSAGNYLYPSTSTTQAKMINGLRAMGYSTPNSYSSYNYSTVRNSIINQRPVIMSGQTGDSGHAWIIDGVRTMTYTEYLADGTSWVWNTGDNKKFVSCNVGWGTDTYNAWYQSGVFDFRAGYQSKVPRSVIPYYYQYDIKMLPNVYWP